MVHAAFNRLFQMGGAGASSSAMMLMGAFLTAFAVSAASGRPLIAVLRRFGMIERTEKTPIEDSRIRAGIEAKENIPTMGGLIIGAGLAGGTLLWGDLKSAELWLCLGSFVLLGAFGMLDDYLKARGAGRRDRGLRVRSKLLFQGAVGLGLGLMYWIFVRAALPEIDWPVPGHGYLLSNPVLWLGASVLVVGVLSNSVNVADGMDGLAGGLSVAALLPLALLGALVGPDVPGISGGAALFCAALAGAIMGFLWHNVHPARVFMGDTGALAIGGSFGLAALFSGYGLLLPVLGFVFLAEFASSVIQVLVFKATGRRIFPIAPIHHIFQQKKWPEMRTVVRFWIAGMLCSMATLALAATLIGMS